MGSLLWETQTDKLSGSRKATNCALAAANTYLPLVKMLLIRANMRGSLQEQRTLNLNYVLVVSEKYCLVLKEYVGVIPTSNITLRT